MPVTEDKTPNDINLGSFTNYEQKYGSMKLKLKSILYENELLQDELRKVQRELLDIYRDKETLLEKIVQFDDVSCSSSDSESQQKISELSKQPQPPHQVNQADALTTIAAATSVAGLIKPTTALPVIPPVITILPTTATITTTTAAPTAVFTTSSNTATTKPAATTNSANTTKKRTTKPKVTKPKTTTAASNKNGTSTGKPAQVKNTQPQAPNNTTTKPPTPAAARKKNDAKPKAPRVRNKPQQAAKQQQTQVKTIAQNQTIQIQPQINLQQHLQQQIQPHHHTTLSQYSNQPQQIQIQLQMQPNNQQQQHHLDPTHMQQIPQILSSTQMQPITSQQTQIQIQPPQQQQQLSQPSISTPSTQPTQIGLTTQAPTLLTQHSRLPQHITPTQMQTTQHMHQLHLPTMQQHQQQQQQQQQQPQETNQIRLNHHQQHLRPMSNMYGNVQQVQQVMQLSDVRIISKINHPLQNNNTHDVISKNDNNNPINNDDTTNSVIHTNGDLMQATQQLSAEELEQHLEIRRMEQAALLLPDWESSVPTELALNSIKFMAED